VSTGNFGAKSKVKKIRTHDKKSFYPIVRDSGRLFTNKVKKVCQKELKKLAKLCSTVRAKSKHI